MVILLPFFLKSIVSNVNTPAWLESHSAYSLNTEDGIPLRLKPVRDNMRISFLFRRCCVWDYLEFHSYDIWQSNKISTSNLWNFLRTRNCQHITSQVPMHRLHHSGNQSIMGCKHSVDVEPTDWKNFQRQSKEKRKSTPTMSFASDGSKTYVFGDACDIPQGYAFPSITIVDTHNDRHENFSMSAQSTMRSM